VIHVLLVLKHYPWKNGFEASQEYDDAMRILENRMAEIRASFDSKLEGEPNKMKTNTLIINLGVLYYIIFF